MDSEWLQDSSYEGERDGDIFVGLADWRGLASCLHCILSRQKWRYRNDVESQSWAEDMGREKHFLWDRSKGKKEPWRDGGDADDGSLDPLGTLLGYKSFRAALRIVEPSVMQIHDLFTATHPGEEGCMLVGMKGHILILRLLSLCMSKESIQGLAS